MITQTPIQFEGVFADELTKYIAYKRSLDLQYDRAEYDLVTFSKFLVENNVSRMLISKEIAEKWCCKRDDESHKNWSNRTVIYRQFAIYLNKKRLFCVYTTYTSKIYDKIYSIYFHKRGNFKYFPCSRHKRCKKT